MKVADISVSRAHTIIRYVNDQLIVCDGGSRYGTLIRITKPSPIL